MRGSGIEFTRNWHGDSARFPVGGALVRDLTSVWRRTIMKAVVKVAPGEGNVELKDIPEPFPGPGEVMIRVEAAGICGSDIHIRHGDIQIPMRPPFVIGHEFAGVIESVGEGVGRWSIGERVTAENSRTVCGHCRHCATGDYNLCKERLATGYAFDGAFARYCVVPDYRVHRLPDNVDFISGALSDPSACAFHAVHDLTGVDAGDLVLITGPGPMGLFCTQYVKANGGRVILTGLPRDRSRLSLGVELGADHTVVNGEDDLAGLVGSLSGGEGVDTVLECSGAQTAAQTGISLVRRQGKYTQVGIFGGPVTVDLAQLVYKEIRMTGSFSQKFLAWEAAIRLCSQGKIKARPLVTDVLRLEQWEEGFERFESGEAIKVVFEPWREQV